jgi:hypothetical protein
MIEEILGTATCRLSQRYWTSRPTAPGVSFCILVITVCQLVAVRMVVRRGGRGLVDVRRDG